MSKIKTVGAMRLQTRSSNVALIKPSSQFAVPWAYVKKIIINYQ